MRDALALFRQYKALGEKAMAQVDEDGLQAKLDPEMNSIALIVKHMAGNMRSRWTNFLTSDGEKPDRMRDREFEDAPGTRAEVLAMWEEGWGHVFAALEPLTDNDLARRVTIRGEVHSVMQAINRQVTHYAMHVGQMVFLAKHLRGGEWKSLSIPRGESEKFNRRMGQK